MATSNWRVCWRVSTLRQGKGNQPQRNNEVRLTSPDGRPHPAVFADVPVTGVAGIPRMVEVGDAFRPAAVYRSAVVHPLGLLAQKGRFAGGPRTAGQRAAAEVDREILGNPDRQEAEV